MDNLNPEQTEKLVDLLDGKLSAVDQTELERSIRETPAMQSAWEDLLITREAVRIGGLQQQVASIHQQMMAEQEAAQKKPGTVRRMIRYSFAVAAALLLIIGGYLAYSFYSLSPNGVFNENYQSYELRSLRGENGSLTEVEKAYQAHNYAGVIKLSAGTTEIKTLFLEAMSQLELKNNTAAISLFKQILATDQATSSTIRKEESEYYLALAYIRNKDYDFALDLLHTIYNNPDHTYNSKVTSKLLRQVRMLKWR